MASSLPAGPINQTFVAFDLKDMVGSLSQSLRDVSNLERILNLNLLLIVTMIAVLILWTLIRSFVLPTRPQADRIVRHEIVSHSSPASVTWSSYRPENAAKLKNHEDVTVEN